MKRQRGNILFLILLAVVLFAALAYAVTSSLRGGGSDAGSEKAAATAATIVDYGTTLANIVTRMRLTNDCKDYQLSFYQTIVPTGYTNASAPSPKCFVFDPAGGGATWLEVPTAWLDTSAAASFPNSYGKIHVSIQSMMPNIGTSESLGLGQELTLVIPFIKQDICAEIDRQLGWPGIGVNDFPAFDLENTGSRFNGSYNLYNGPRFLYNGERITSRMNGCFTGSVPGSRPPSGYYYYFHVLSVR